MLEEFDEMVEGKLELMANIMSAWHTSAYVEISKSGGLSTQHHAMGDTRGLTSTIIGQDF